MTVYRTCESQVEKMNSDYYDLTPHPPLTKADVTHNFNLLLSGGYDETDEHPVPSFHTYYPTSK